jgi:Big-like domain-containing protein
MRLLRSLGAIRQGVRGSRLALLLLLASAWLGLAAGPASATGFSNPGSITLNKNPGSSGATDATPYPSTITVSGTTGTISNVTLSINNVTFPFSQDIDLLLVGPPGTNAQSLVALSELGPNSGASAAASNSTLTISDAGTLPTETTAWGSASTFKPVNFGPTFNEVFGPPAPAAPWGDPGTTGTGATLGSVFDGLAANGTWSLYVIINEPGDGPGVIAGGWTLNITTASAAAATTTTVSSSTNPSFTSGAGSSTTLSATVKKSSDNSNVNEGTVKFTDNGVTISGCGAQPVSAGAASCTTTFTTEGVHTVEAVYSGTANFGSSNSPTLAQQVDNHTTVTGSSYCNTGSITLNNPAVTTADDSPYPSHVFVSGLSGTLSHLTVTLNGATYPESQDIDALLVGPTGQTFILVAAAGPNSSGAISNVTLTLDDNASSTIAATSPWGSPGSTVTSKPVNYGGVNETWNSPAPAGPYGNPGPAGGGTATLGTAFDGSNPNGTWSLYIVTTAAGDGTGAISGGWCANVQTSGAAATTTTLTSSVNPSFTTAPNNTTALSATVKKASDSSNVSEGTVDFTDNGITIPGCGAVSVSAGTATCNKAFTTEGVHTIQALYSGDANFGGSSATVSQDVNDHTTVTGNSYCNSGSIALNNPDINNPEADATPYPSEVFVTGNPGQTTHLTVTLNNVTYPDSQDIDGLLVGPGGQTLILVAAAGPNSGGALSNVTLTLDDNATSTISSSAAWGAMNSTVTSKPVNYGGLNEVFGPPAPAGPYGNPGPNGGGTATLGSTFNGSSANGTWSLYLITTSGGDGTGAAAGGWCLGVTGPQPPTLTKSFAASSVPLNGSTTLSFTVSNPNTSQQLTGVGFTDTLPSGLVVSTPNGASGSCGVGTITAVAGSSSVSLSGATLASSSSCTFSVSVTGTTAGSKVNTTSAPASTEGGSGTPATATLAVIAPPTLTKAFGAPSITLNTATSLTFTVTNPNTSSSLSGIGFTDTLPSGLVVSTPNALSGTCGVGTITAAAGSGSVSLSGATLAGSANCTFSVNVTGTATGAQVNTTSTVSSTEGGSGAAATATVNVVAAPPQITKAFGAPSIPLNGSTTLSFTITNPANNGTATGIAFTDTLPAGLVVSTPNGLTGSCGGGTITATAGASSVSLSGATLVAAAPCTFSVNVTGSSAGVKNNSVTVSSNEGGTGNTATASLTVVAPPTLSKSFVAASVPLNGSTFLILTATNPNATVPLSGVGYTDTLPAGLVIATDNMLSQSCVPPGTISAVAGSSLVSLSGATLAANASCTISLEVTGTTAGPKVNTTSTISSTEGGSGAAATATLTVAAGPVQISKAFGAATIPLNGSTTLSFTINNPAANGTSTGVAFTDTLPAGLVVSTPNGLTGSCGGTITAAAGASSVSLSGATLTGGENCTFSVSVTGTAAGVKTNAVTVSSTEGGTGNTATASITVVAPPSLAKVFGAPSIPLAGTTTSLMFTANNPNSAVTLTGVAFTDTLPAGLVVATPNGLTGNCGGTVTAVAGSTSVTLSGASLAANSPCAFSVNVAATAAGSQVNTTSPISSTEGGSGAPATATLTVVAPPVIAKSFGAPTLPLNGSTSLTFTVANPVANTVTLTGVGFTDTMPTGLVVATPNGLSGSCGVGTITAIAGSNSVVLAGASLTPGGSCTFSVNVTATASGQKTNSVTVTSTNGGIGNTATASLQAALPPSITKTFGAATIPLNGSTALSFTITNPVANGAQSLSGIAFTDALPAGLVVSSPNGLTSSCSGGTITATAGSTSVSLSGATLVGGASCTISVNVTGTTAGVENNSVSVTSTEGGAGNTSTASLTVVAPPSITKFFGATSVPLAGSTTLTFSVIDPNASGTLTGVGFTDTLPAGLVVSTPNGLTAACGSGTITAAAGSSSVTVSGATVAPGPGCTFSVNVTGTAAGAQVNTTSVVSSNEGGSGAPATATLDVVAPPVIAKAFGAANVPINGTTSLTFTLTNPNPTFAVDKVAFTDTFPAGLVVATPSAATSDCADANAMANPGSGTASVSNVLLPAGGSCTFSFNVTATTSGTKVNSVSVTSLTGGTGNTATATLQVALPPVIAKSFGAATIPLNGSTALSFTITNPVANGSQSLSGIAFTDTLPAGLVVTTPNGLTGACGGGTITATAGSSAVSLSGATLLTGGASCTFSVNVTGTVAGTDTNSVSVTSTTSGPGNTATASIIVVAPPTITKAFGAASIPVGGSTSLTFTVSNPNTGAALNGVGFTDTLPGGLVVATPNALSGGCGVGTIVATPGSSAVVLSGASLATGSQCTFSVNVAGTSRGLQMNSVTATSANGGTGAPGTASVTVVAPPQLTKAFGVATLPFGATTTLTFTAANPNTGTTLHGVGFTDTLPSGLVVATPNGLTGSCGAGTIAATAGGTAISLSGATLVAASNCSFTVGVTAIALGVQNNTTSAVSSTEGGSGSPATASVTVGRAPTTVSVVALPPSAAFGSSITFTATVAPSQSNGSGTNPTGTVAFFLDGGTTPVATVPLVGGMASFTTSGLSSGSHSVVAVYSGDANFLGATSAPASVTLTCATTITGTHSASPIGAGATCVIGAHISGAVLVHTGAAVDIENSTISGPFAATGAASVRICGSTINGSVDIEQSTGLVIVGDPADECAPNTITGSLIVRNNTGGVVAIGNTVSGATSISGNSGPGPFPG